MLSLLRGLIRFDKTFFKEPIKLFHAESEVGGARCAIFVESLAAPLVFVEEDVVPALGDIYDNGLTVAALIEIGSWDHIGVC